ncbi:hypothetical protein A9G00_24875 [Achromobacter xylosoxidans]|nr:hypothetical protein A9G00_24875 [Achromobacter xylosoxidans]
MSFDVIIIGSGLAGMAAALELAPHRRVALVSKGALLAGASAHAQGGIAAPLGPGDSVADHLRDTLDAGAGLCDANAARAIIDQACAAIAWLQAQGVAFSMEGAGLHLTREGGHGQRRIAHAADATGRAIMAALGAQVRRQAAITVLERHCAVELLLPATPGARCQGVRLLDLDRRLQRHVAANHVVIASGGAGQVYATTTAPPGATGDGIALAARAGARTANLAFTQFHPTGLHHPRGGGFLISEAVAGLYAVGEAACTGLHGANRLASNSLLECVVTGRAAARDILAGPPPASVPAPPSGDTAQASLDVTPAAWIQSRRETLRAIMTRDAGIVRSDASLRRAAGHIARLRRALARRIDDGPALRELRNLATVAALIVRDARARRESRGAHFNVDRPGPPPGLPPAPMPAYRAD